MIRRSDSPAPAPGIRLSGPWHLGGAAGALALGALFFWRWQGYADVWIDDAFISFRYARNWAEGLGPVYNPGEAVAGYTNFAWMALCALAFRIFAESAALDAIRALGVALSLFTLWRAFRFPTPDGRATHRFALLLLAAHPLWAVNAGDGLETPLAAALLIELARAIAAPLTARQGWLAGALTALLVWTRPEALPLVGLLPVLAYATRRGDEALVPWLRGFAVAALVPIGLHFAWSFATYGALLPNTYLAKATGDPIARLGRGARQLGLLLGGHPFLWPLTLWSALGLAAFACARRVREAPRWTGVLALVVGFRFAFELWSGGAFMGVFRFIAPALPPLFVLADEGARQLLRDFATDRTRQRATLAALLGIALLGAALDHLGNERLVRTRNAYAKALGQAHVSLGHFLAERYAPDTWVALGDAGAIPFYSRLSTIDLWGLNDRAIARLPGEYGARPGTADHALGRAPGLFVLWSLVPWHQGFEGGQSFDRAIAAAPAFRARYRFVRQFTFRPARPGRPGYYLLVFERGEPAAVAGSGGGATSR